MGSTEEEVHSESSINSLSIPWSRLRDREPPSGTFPLSLEGVSGTSRGRGVAAQAATHWECQGAAVGSRHQLQEPRAIRADAGTGPSQRPTCSSEFSCGADIPSPSGYHHVCHSFLLRQGHDMTSDPRALPYVTSPGSPGPVRPSRSSSPCSSSSARSLLGEWKSLHYTKTSRVTLDSQWPRAPQPEALLLFPSARSPGRRVCGSLSSLTAPAPAHAVAAGTAAEPAVTSLVPSGNPESPSRRCTLSCAQHHSWRYPRGLHSFLEGNPRPKSPQE